MMFSGLQVNLSYAKGEVYGIYHLLLKPFQSSMCVMDFLNKFGRSAYLCIKFLLF